MLSFNNTKSASGLVVKSIVAIDGPRVRFAAGANLLHFFSRSVCAPEDDFLSLALVSSVSFFWYSKVSKSNPFVYNYLKQNLEARVRMLQRIFYVSHNDSEQMQDHFPDLPEPPLDHASSGMLPPSMHPSKSAGPIKLHWPSELQFGRHPP